MEVVLVAFVPFLLSVFVPLLLLPIVVTPFGLSIIVLVLVTEGG